MPYDLINEKDGRGVVIVWSGLVSASEISTINDLIYSEDRVATLRYQIWDFSKAVRDKKPNVSSGDIRDFVMQDGAALKQNPKMIMALVGSESFFGGVQNIYKIFAEIWAGELKCEVFPTMQAARAWIAKECPESES